MAVTVIDGRVMTVAAIARLSRTLLGWHSITGGPSMQVFVTGASGHVGSAVIPELLGAGHEVVGLARSDASAAAVKALGAKVHRGALDDLDSLREAVTSSDGVIHLAFKHEEMASGNFEGAAVHLGPEGLHCCGGRVRTGKSDDLVPGSEKLGDNGGTDVAGRSGDEYLHGRTSCYRVPPQ